MATNAEINVFNMNPAFSRRLSEALLSRIATRYGSFKTISDDFLMIWPNPGQASVSR